MTYRTSSKLWGPLIALILIAGVFSASPAHAHKIKKGNYFCSQTSATINILADNK